MANPEVNPFRQIHDGFWDMLEARADFCALIPEANRLKIYDDTGLGIGEPAHPDQHLPGPGPAIRILQTGVGYHSHGDTTGTALALKWEIEIFTGRRYINKLLDAVWSILRATEAWRSHLGALTYRDKTFIKSCRPLLSEDRIDDVKLNQAIRGWTSVWQGEVECWFLVSEMIDSST